MALPSTPLAPRIDDPVELLLACHDKVRRFAALTVRLRDHMAQHGVDEQAREAARSILRYFEIAAPLHHEDEEADLFPALRTLGRPTLDACMDELTAEHERLGGLWAAVQPWLQGTADGHCRAAPVEVDEFARQYVDHAGREEALVYPDARGLSRDQIETIARAMVARRTT